MTSEPVREHATLTGQLVRYAVVGISVNVLLFVGYVVLTNFGLAPKVASTAVFIGGAGLSFVSHRRLTFRAATEVSTQAARYAAVQGFAWAANMGVLHVAVQWLLLPHVLVEGALILATAAFLFLAQRLYVYPQAPSGAGTSRAPLRALTSGLNVLLLALFAGLLLVRAYTTLDWRMEHDTPLLHYAARLIERDGRIPYRDLFETSMPGTFLFHAVIGGLFGYGDVAFRGVDLALLAVLLGTTGLFARRFGRYAALWSAVVFGLEYLSFGQRMSLQRDYLGVIPIALALVCIPASAATPPRVWRFAAVGLLFGVAALIKPHLAVALPIVLWALLTLRRGAGASRRDALGCLAVAAVASLLPPGAALAWLARHDALAPFLDMFLRYLPLHSALTGHQQTIAGLARAQYLLLYAPMIGGFGALALGGVGAFVHVAAHPARDRGVTVSAVCIAGCALAFALYPVLAGKFWDYHYMPFAWFCSLSIGLWFFRWEEEDVEPDLVFLRIPRLVVPVLVIFQQLPVPETLAAVAADLQTGPEAHVPTFGRPDEIGAWLQERLRPGDTVQPLDWTGGSVHGMLIADARLATGFLYDYHFYHHVSRPVIQELRTSFIAQLRAAMPRYVIEVTTDKPWVGGEDTTQAFPELQELLDTRYALAHEGAGYRILERLDLYAPGG